MQGKYRNVVFYRLLFSLKFVGTVFIFSVISSHVISESSVILAKYLPFLQVYVEWFQ